MYTTCCLSDTTICQNLVYISHRAKTILPYLNSYIILIWRSKYKVIQRSWLYTRHHTMVIYLSAKHNMTMSKDKKAVVQTQSHVINPIHLTLRLKDVVSGSRMLAIHPLMKTCQIPFKIDLEIKGQRHIGIMNVCHTLSNCDTPMCHIWEATVKQKKKVIGQAQICRQMDRQTETDRVIPINPTEIRLRWV